jgi:DNA-binding beta-propeller fold protein YncE
VLDYGNDRVVRLDTVHGDREKVFGGLTDPFGVSDDRTGLYVADTYAGRVLKLAKGSGDPIWEQNQCNATAFLRPRDVAVGSNGDVYVADTDNNRIVRLNPGNGDCITEFGSTGSAPGELKAPRSIGATKGGLWITEGNGARIQRFRNGGSYVQGSAFGSYGTSRNEFRSPHCVFIDGKLVDVCDTFNFRIQRFKVVSGHLRYHSTIGGRKPSNGGFNEPWDVAYGPNGVMFVTDSFNHRIEKFNAKGNFVMAWGGYGTPPGSFIFPRGIAVSGNTVVVTDSENNRIDLFSLQGVFLDSIKPDAPDRFSRPHQTAVAGDGSFWVADTLNNRAVHLDSDGTVQGVISGLNRPRGIAVDGSDVYVAHGAGGSSVVEVFTSAGAPVMDLATQGTANGEVRTPYGLRIAVIDGQKVLIVADRDNNRVQLFNLSGGFLGKLAGGLTQPQGADARGNGTVAVANFGRNRVSLWAT